MGKLHLLQKRSINTSLPRPDSVSFFSVEGSDSGLSTPRMLDVLLHKLLNIKSYSRVLVSTYDPLNILAKKELILNRCPNLITFESVPIRNDYPRLFLVSAQYNDTVGLRRSKGSSFTSQQEASLKAFGEYLERFYGLHTDHYLKLSSRKKTCHFKPKHSSLELSSLPRPIKRQKVYSFFPKDLTEIFELDASWALNTTTNKKELLPIVLLYYGFKQQKKFLQPATTNGGGGGFTLESARLSAIYELIERDHFLLFWVTKTAPEIIKTSTLPLVISNKIRYFEERYNISIYILNTTYQIDVFSCMVFVVDDQLHRVSVGGSAGIDICHTIEKALAEAVTELHFSSEKEVSSLLSFSTAAESPFTNEYITKNIRKDFYNNEEGISLIRKLFLSGKEKDYQDIKYLEKIFESKKEELTYIENIFKILSQKAGGGYHLYFFEYEGTLLQNFNYFVSKAFVPSFLKLWLEENNATPSGERIERFCKDNGKIYDESILNPYPHPLS